MPQSASSGELNAKTSLGLPSRKKINSDATRLSDARAEKTLSELANVGGEGDDCFEEVF
jgi:hypothetical protein